MGRDAKLVIVEKMEVPGNAGEVILVGEGGKIGGMNHCCPCGCGRWSYMGLDPSVNTTSATWKQTAGTSLLDATLEPSIGIRRNSKEIALGLTGFHWHGWLRNGIFVEG